MTNITPPSADFVTTTLNGAITNVATTMTIGTGLDLPAASGILQIDYDSAIAVGTDEGPETVFYTAYNSGTGAITGMTRGSAGTTGVAHDNGSSIQAAPSSAYLGASNALIGSDLYKMQNIGAHVTLAANQLNLVDSTWTKVLLDTETYDLGNDFASNKFTVPTGGDGYYLITAKVSFTNCIALKNYAGAIYKNGSLNTVNYNHAALTASIAIPITTIINLTATDYIELYAESLSGGNTVDIHGTTLYTFLCVQFLHS